MLNTNFLFTQQLNNYKNQQYSKIYQHELAHKQAAGALGGPIVIEKDNNGVATAGHVDIKMPQLNSENPDETIKDANTVINAALAPSDPSDQDLKVAKDAKDILSDAKDAKNNSNSVNSNSDASNCTDPNCGNKLNFWA